MTIDEIYKIFDLHRKVDCAVNPETYMCEANIYPSHLDDILDALKKDYSLCLDFFKTITLDFFRFAPKTNSIFFKEILKKHKKLELLNALNNRVHSFKSRHETTKMNELYKECIVFCK